MKHIHQNQEFRFNEVLFEHRNKEYGAYVLRNESDKILTKALFIGVSLLAAISLTPLAINAFKSDVVKVPEGVIIDLVEPVVPPDVVVVPPKAQPVPQTTAPNVKTVDDRLPEPKANVTNERVVEKIEGAVSGIKNNSDGEIAPTNTYIPITAPTIKTGPPVQPTAEPKKEDPNVIPTVVDVEATFPGGIDSFRNKVMNNFDNSGLDSGDLMKTTITFIVERDGTISGIKADGKNADFNSEALRTVKSIKGKWIPAKVKGQPVRSYFKFPISMKFD
jgi:protein TonB